MIFAFEADGLSVSDGMGQLDSRPGVVKSKSVTFEDIYVALCVEVGEAIGEFEFIAVDPYRAVGSCRIAVGCSRAHGAGRQVPAVN